MLLLESKNKITTFHSVSWKRRCWPSAFIIQKFMNRQSNMNDSYRYIEPLIATSLPFLVTLAWPLVGCDGRRRKWNAISNNAVQIRYMLIVYPQARSIVYIVLVQFFWCHMRRIFVSRCQRHGLQKLNAFSLSFCDTIVWLCLRNWKRIRHEKRREWFPSCIRQREW